MTEIGMTVFVGGHLLLGELVLALALDEKPD